ncbi:YnfA family protein [Acetobacter oeni]
MTILIYTAAALAEIGGCYSFRIYLREGRTPLWLVPGCASLVLFARLLTLIDTNAAGRAYAAYGGIYITVALIWLRAVDGVHPDRADIAGVLLSLAGAAIILPAPYRN